MTTKGFTFTVGEDFTGVAISNVFQSLLQHGVRWIMTMRTVCVQGIAILLHPECTVGK